MSFSMESDAPAHGTSGNGSSRNTTALLYVDGKPCAASMRPPVTRRKRGTETIVRDRVSSNLQARETAGPLLNLSSVGSIVAASANGFRHADEWAKTNPPTDQQRVSQDVLNGVLGSCPLPEETSPGRCVEVLRLLGREEFEALTFNIFAFAHTLALKVRARTRAA
jgi:hypothetical protein